MTIRFKIPFMFYVQCNVQIHYIMVWNTFWIAGFFQILLHMDIQGPPLFVHVVVEWPLNKYWYWRFCFFPIDLSNVMISLSEKGGSRGNADVLVQSTNHFGTVIIITPVFDIVRKVFSRWTWRTLTPWSILLTITLTICYVTNIRMWSSRVKAVTRFTIRKTKESL